MKYIKMFIAGMAFPSALLPFLFLIAWSFGKIQIFNHPFFHFIPLIWGVWNILYFTCFLKFLPKHSTLRLLLIGGILGLLIVGYGVFGLDVPRLMGFSKSFAYLPLIIGPVMYAIFWLYIVNFINQLLGIRERG